MLYKNDPCIFSWELTNEPQFPSYDWVDSTAKFIKSFSKHLVTVGLESKEDEFDFLNAHSSPFIDYCTVHIWAQNRGVYDMMNSSVENLQASIDWALGKVDLAETWASRLGKPIVLEE